MLCIIQTYASVIGIALLGKAVILINIYNIFGRMETSIGKQNGKPY